MIIMIDSLSDWCCYCYCYWYELKKNKSKRWNGMFTWCVNDIIE